MGEDVIAYARANYETVLMIVYNLFVEYGRAVGNHQAHKGIWPSNRLRTDWPIFKWVDAQVCNYQ